MSNQYESASTLKTNITSEKYNPVADTAAIVQCKKARFTVLTSALIRMEWTQDSIFEDRSSFIFLHRHLAVPDFTVYKENGGVCIQTEELKLSYKPTGDGKFTDDTLSVQFIVDGEPFQWRPGMDDKGNLGGTNRSLDWWEGNKLHEPRSDRAYVMNEEPIHPGLLSKDGWILIDDSDGYLFDDSDFSFESGEESQLPWVTSRQFGERQDWYLFAYGRDYRRLLGDYVKLSGRIALPPKYAFGIWWSRYTIYCDKEAVDLVDAFHSRGLPLDVFVLDLEWHRAYVEEWLKGTLDQSGRGIGFHGYSWNRLLFPEPKYFYNEMHRRGVSVGLNLHPSQGVQPHEDRYADMCHAMGQDPAEGEYIPLNITDKKFTESNMKFMHHPTDALGNDFWWNDHIDGNMTNLPGLHNITWMAYVFDVDLARQGKRPLCLHRWGGLGCHRYPIQFSGDVFSCWETLRFEMSFTAQSANACSAYWSHDLGGHYPGPVEKELYTRWIQFGLFSPVMRTHCSKNPEAERLIWAYPEPNASIMRDAFLHRHAMLPYIYTEARCAFDSGVAFLHALYLDYPQQPEAYNHPEEYAFGENLIAAPIFVPVEKDRCVADQTIWIPPEEWYDLSTGTLIEGPGVHVQSYLLSEIPVLQKAGSIVPLQLHTGRINEKSDILGLRIAPATGSGTSEYSIYDDDGNGRDYEEDIGVCKTHVSATWDDNSICITVDAVESTMEEIKDDRHVEVILLGVIPADAVIVNGIAVTQVNCAESYWWYDCHDFSIHIRSSKQSSAKQITVNAIWNEARWVPLINGVTGAANRLSMAYQLINNAWPGGFPPDSLIKAVQTGRLIQTNPKEARGILCSLHENLSMIQHDVEHQEKQFCQNGIHMLERIGTLNTSEQMQNRVAAVIKLFVKSRALVSQAAKLLK